MSYISSLVLSGCLFVSRISNNINMTLCALIFMAPDKIKQLLLMTEFFYVVKLNTEIF